MYRLTGGTVPLIGAGGVASGAEAYAKVRAGASAVQLYTGMVYGGAALVPRIKGARAGARASADPATAADMPTTRRCHCRPRLFVLGWSLLFKRLFFPLSRRGARGPPPPGRFQVGAGSLPCVLML